MNSSPPWEKLWHSATIACVNEGGAPYGLIENGALAVKKGEIAWVGKVFELPGPPKELASEVLDEKGRCPTQRLID